MRTLVRCWIVRDADCPLARSLPDKGAVPTATATVNVLTRYVVKTSHARTSASQAKANDVGCAPLNGVLEQFGCYAVVDREALAFEWSMASKE